MVGPRRSYFLPGRQTLDTSKCLFLELVLIHLLFKFRQKRGNLGRGWEIQRTQPRLPLTPKVRQNKSESATLRFKAFQNDSSEGLLPY